MDAAISLKPPDVFEFPFTPYEIQHEFMTNLYTTIENKKFGVFESPTGTGKSLSIICGVLKWLKDYNENLKFTLKSNIQKLEQQKAILSASTVDWLKCQAEEIKITRTLAQLKLDQNKITAYDEKIELLKNKHLSTKKPSTFLRKQTENAATIVGTIVEDEDACLSDEFEVMESDGESDEETDDKYEPVKIFICSRTHSQLAQFVGEIIKSPYGKCTRTVSLASRQNYCINPNVVRLKNMSLINERCLDMQKRNSRATKTDEGKVTKRRRASNCQCPYYKQQNIDTLKDFALTEIYDIEDLVSVGKELAACPYYASRKAAEDAQIVLIPYNTLLHKPTREANGIKLKNNVVVIDEAHNLLEALSQMYGCSVTYEQLSHSRTQLKGYKERYGTRFNAQNLLCVNQLIFICTKLADVLEKCEKGEKINTIQEFVLSAEIDNFNMFKMVQFCRTSKISQKLHRFAVQNPCTERANAPITKNLKDFLLSIEKTKPVKNKPVEIAREALKPENVPSNPLLPVIAFLEALTYSYEDGRILSQKGDDEKYSKFRFLVLNSAAHFKEIVQDTRSVIVAGGTMKPISEFRDRLFGSAGIVTDRIIEFSCDHIVPSENILPVILTKDHKNNAFLFNYENRLKMGPSLKMVVQEACQKVPGGIVVFFPSYKYESWFWQQVQGVVFNRPVFREPQDSGSVDGVLSSYAEAVIKSKSGALLFSVVGGKLSEGLNFSDDLGRCVIVVGLPYANVKAVDLKEKMGYLDKIEGSGAGQKFYEGLCFKAVNQCIGRAVRHRNDYAAVLLVDERFNRASSKSALPNWIRRSLTTCTYQECFEVVDKFFVQRI